MTRIGAVGARISYFIFATILIHQGQAYLNCPGDNQTIYYNSDGEAYLLDCTADYSGNDAGIYFPAYNWENCTLACDATFGCTAFVFSAPGPMADCFLKSSTGSGAVRTNSNLWGGIMLGLSGSVSSSAASVKSIA